MIVFYLIPQAITSVIEEFLLENRTNPSANLKSAKTGANTGTRGFEVLIKTPYFPNKSGNLGSNESNKDPYKEPIKS